MTEPVNVDIQTPQGSVHVGRAFIAARRGVTTTSFNYDADFLGRPDSYAIDPALPIARGTPLSQGTSGGIRGCIP